MTTPRQGSDTDAVPLPRARAQREPDAPLWPLLAGDEQARAGVSVDLARSSLERQGALDLRCDVYRRKGLLPPDALKAQVLPQVCAPGSAILVAKEAGAIVGTITFYMDSPLGLPMDVVHREEVEATRRRFARVAEVGGLAVREDRRGWGVTLMLYEATVCWALATRAEYLVACVNPSSRRVYSRLLFFDVLGECRQHPRFAGAPSIPIGLDLARAPERYRPAWPGGAEGGPACLREMQPPHGANDAQRRLPWSDDEVAQMVESGQLVLDGDDHLYVQRHYASVALARCPR